MYCLHFRMVFWWKILLHDRTQASFIHSARDAQIETLCRFCTDQKKFSTDTLQGHCIDDETIKTSESGSDSIRQSLSHTEVEASATRVNDNHRPTFE
jgi:hypothetical protein